MTQLSDLLNLPEDLDEKSVQFLLKAIVDRNQKGFDYLEFMASVKKLEEMPMDTETAYKSAFTTASTFGITKEGLTISARKYIGVIRSEYDMFKTALMRQIGERVQGPTDEVAKLKKRKLDIESEIEKLKKEYASIDGKVEQIEAAIEQEKSSLQERESQFHTTFEAIKEAIESDIQQIEQNL